MLTLNGVYEAMDPRNYKNKITECTINIDGKDIIVQLPVYRYITKIYSTLDRYIENLKTYTIYLLINNDKVDFHDNSHKDSYYVKIISIINNTTIKCSLTDKEFLINPDRIINYEYVPKDNDKIHSLLNWPEFFNNSDLLTCLTENHDCLYLCISNDKFELIYAHVTVFADGIIRCEFMNQDFEFNTYDKFDYIFYDYYCQSCGDDGEKCSKSDTL